MQEVLLELMRYLPVIVVFGTPVAILATLRHYKFKEKELAAKTANPLLLEAATKQNRLLEARIQNLETIVCSVDHELNQRLNRVAAEASMAGRLLPPGAAGSSAATAPTLGRDRAYALGHLDDGAVVLDRYKIIR